MLDVEVGLVGLTRKDVIFPAVVQQCQAHDS